MAPRFVPPSLPIPVLKYGLTMRTALFAESETLGYGYTYYSMSELYLVYGTELAVQQARNRRVFIYFLYVLFAPFISIAFKTSNIYRS